MLCLHPSSLRRIELTQILISHSLTHYNTTTPHHLNAPVEPAAMLANTASKTAVLVALCAVAHAVSDIAVPSSITADTLFNTTFQQAVADSSHYYRVFLAASVTGIQGPMCYLMNATLLSSPLNLTIPADVGPDASYYSIGIKDLLYKTVPYGNPAAQSATNLPFGDPAASTGESSSTSLQYSNQFNLTLATGTPTQYEQHLNGAPFWDANKLPCSAMSCARTCAAASYPANLQEGASYETLKNCILQCPGVEADQSLHAADGSPSSIAGAAVTLSGGNVVTALETVVPTGGSTITEAIVGSATLVLGSAAATVSDRSLSLGASGLVVDGTTTVAFSNVASTSGVAATSSQASAVSQGVGPMATVASGCVAAVGVAAGFAMLAL